MTIERKCKTCQWWFPNQSIEPKILDENGEPERRCWNENMGGIRDDDFSCEYHLADTDYQINLPNHTPKGSMTEPNPNKVDGATEIFIATYGTPTKRVSGVVVSDFDWLIYCLRSIKRHCSGFQGITIAHPKHESHIFAPLVERFGVRLYAMDEPIAGKGFLYHMIAMANADKIVPQGTKYILHTDADCIFLMATTPEHYFWNDKPYYIVRSWESLTTEDPHNPGSKVVSDCHQWRNPTDFQLGFKTDVYSMCQNAGVFPIEFYERYRKLISFVHNKSYEDFMLEGSGTHPASRMDWTAMGAFAFRFMHSDFHWFDVSEPPYPIDRKKAYWSHGGLSVEILKEIEGFLK